jgi:condensin complex subunit 1
LAYCIAQLKLNERAIKCLSDNFKLYKDALFDEDIMKSFASVVTKAKKFMKPEMREFLEEWEAKLNELAELGAENEAAGEKAARAKVRASKRAARKKKQVKVLDAVLEDEEEEADELEFEGEVDSVNKENTPVSTKKSRSSARGQRGTIST